MWLYLPFLANLYLKLFSLSLSCAALPYCSVSFIFPTSLIESASFFLLPLSFFPSPTTLYHFSLDSLSVWQGIASICASPMCGGLHWTLLMELLCSKRLQRSRAIQCNESGHCARGDIGALGEWVREREREGGNSEWCLRESHEKAALLCLSESGEQYQVCRSAKILWLVSGANPCEVYSSPKSQKREDGARSVNVE